MDCFNKCHKPYIWDGRNWDTIDAPIILWSKSARGIPFFSITTS